MSTRLNWPLLLSEFVVIVVGVLLALWVDELREARNNAELEVQYLESLALTREMDVDLVLPGHGGPVTAHRKLIDQRFALHRRRADKIHALLEKRASTAYELSQALWGNIAVTQAYLTLAEVLGHLDVLVNAGRVREVERNGLSAFEAVGRPAPAQE